MTVDNKPTTSGIGDSPELDSVTTGMSVLDAMVDAFDAGQPSDVVVVTYVGVRQSFGPAVGVDDAAAHWEFYDRCVGTGVAPANVPESLTVGYERAAYSGLSVGDEAAAESVETACSLADTAAPNATDSSDPDGDADVSEAADVVE